MLHQHGSHTPEAPVLGRHGRLGAGEVAGVRPLLVARGGRRAGKGRAAPEALAMLVGGVDLRQGSLKRKRPAEYLRTVLDSDLTVRVSTRSAA